MEEKVYKEAQREFRLLSGQTKALRKRIEKYPPGYLKINHKLGHVQFYHVIEDHTAEADQREISKYIRKKDRSLAVLLAQKSHDIKLLKELEVRINALEALIRAYSGTDPYAIWSAYGEERKKLVESEYVSDERYAEEWQGKSYPAKAFAPNAPEIYTVKGERVRSKSEKIIADTLERHKIPYRYEYPVELSGGLLIHPDFLVLNQRTRKEYFWEHLGMMDDPEYAAHALKKLERMAESGILPGKNLILTAETSSKVLSVKMMEVLITEYLQ